MDLDEALGIVNDRSKVAYADFIHESVYRRYGEYEIGICPDYDRVAHAYALIAVELAMDGGSLQYTPPDD